MPQQRKTRRRRSLPIFLHTSEPERLLAQLKRPRDRLLALLGLYLGLRVEEIVGRRVEDIDWELGLVEVRQGKGDVDRILPISLTLAPALRAWVGKRTSGWLFPSRQRGCRDKHISARTAERVIKAAALAAGIPRRITPHKLRHTFATMLFKRKANPRSVQELMGHRDLATTMIYAHVTDEDLKQAAALLDEPVNN